MQKYKWLLPLTCFSTLLVVCRVLFTSSLMYSFLVWNIFLAAVPLYLSVKALNAEKKSSLIVYSMLWLLFFPNSMYIVTDLFHLGKKPQVPLWYDLLLIFSSATNGIIYGFLSLSNMEKILNRFSSARVRNLVIFTVMILCGYGIYLGRFERWNSWDVITQPYDLTYSVVSHITHPFKNSDAWLISFCFGMWMYLLYKYVRLVRIKI